MSWSPYPDKKNHKDVPEKISTKCYRNMQNRINDMRLRNPYDPRLEVACS